MTIADSGYKLFLCYSIRWNNRLILRWLWLCCYDVVLILSMHLREWESFTVDFQFQMKVFSMVDIQFRMNVLFMFVSQFRIREFSMAQTNVFSHFSCCFLFRRREFLSLFTVAFTVINFPLGLAMDGSLL